MTKRPPLTIALAALLIALVAVPAYSYLLPFLVRNGIIYSDISNAIVNVLYQFLVLALPALLFYQMKPEYRPALRMRRIDPLCAALLVLAAFIGMVALNQISVFWTLLLRELGLATQTGNSAAPQTTQALWTMLIAGAIAPALFEEVLMRGLLLPSLEPIGTRRAVLLSGVLFALLHGRIEALPVHILLGCILALIVLRTGSLVSAMLYHSTFNASLILVVYYVATHDPEALLAESTLEQAISNLPLSLALTGVWLLLTYTAITRGEKKRKDPLPPAGRKKLTKPEWALLLACLGLLLYTTWLALSAMLPVAGA